MQYESRTVKYLQYNNAGVTDLGQLIQIMDAWYGQTGALNNILTLKHSRPFQKAYMLICHKPAQIIGHAQKKNCWNWSRRSCKRCTWIPDHSRETNRPRTAGNFDCRNRSISFQQRTISMLANPMDQRTETIYKPKNLTLRTKGLLTIKHMPDIFYKTPIKNSYQALCSHPYFNNKWTSTRLHGRNRCTRISTCHALDQVANRFSRPHQLVGLDTEKVFRQNKTGDNHPGTKSASLWDSWGPLQAL